MQGELFAGLDAAQAPSLEPDALRAEARRRLTAELDALAAADASPWPAERAAVRLMVLRNMSRWLPEEERAAMMATLAREVRRLSIQEP